MMEETPDADSETRKDADTRRSRVKSEAQATVKSQTRVRTIRQRAEREDAARLFVVFALSSKFSLKAEVVLKLA